MSVVLIQSPGLRKSYLGLAWSIAWLGLGMQWWLTLALVRSQGGSTLVAAATCLGYFTVLTNLLVAAVLTSAAMGWAPGRSWSVSAASAAAVYIAVVGLVYFFLLSETWHPQGAWWVANGIMHYLTPLLYLGWWILFVEKGSLRWKDCLPWLAFPALYVVGMLVRGAATGFYPYWFVDVSALGYGRVIIHSIGFTAVFLVAGVVLLAVDGWLGRRGARWAHSTSAAHRARSTPRSSDS